MRKRSLLLTMAFVAFGSCAQAQWTPLPPMNWVGPTDASDPECSTWDVTDMGVEPSGSVSYGPMGTAEIAIVPTTSGFAGMIPGATGYRINVDLTCNPGWNLNTVSGLVLVVYMDLDSGLRSTFACYPILGFSAGQGTFHWDSGSMMTPRNTVISASFACTGLGYSTWNGIATPAIWSVPVIVTNFVP